MNKGNHIRYNTNKKERSRRLEKYNTRTLRIGKYNTIIILDWDDTLYPTSWSINNNIDLTSPRDRNKYMDYFNLLDKNISSVLKHMRGLGHVIIITNAMPEWVELSASVLPKTARQLTKINVISARKCYQNKVKMGDWKKYTFMAELKKRLEDNSYNNILSLGDAEYEHKALVSLFHWDKLPHKYLKSIKFIKTCDYNIVIKQIKLIKENISEICKQPRHMDLTFDTK